MNVQLSTVDQSRTTPQGRETATLGIRYTPPVDYQLVSPST